MKEQKLIRVEEIPKKFKGLRPMNEEEKERYIEYAHLTEQKYLVLLVQFFFIQLLFLE